MARGWTGKRMAFAGAAAVVMLLGGVYGVFAWVSGGGDPPVALPSVEPTASATAVFDGDPEGTWTVLKGESLVGYRVREQLVFLSAPNDAVGRTTAVEGSMTIEELQIAWASIGADLTQLESDEARRDDAIRANGLETTTYPTATFELTEPIDFETAPEEGEVVEVEATGELTLHGVTRDVTFPLEARWSGARIDVVGSLEIDFADYGITPPSLGPATVEDHGTIELQLAFVPAP